MQALVKVDNLFGGYGQQAVIKGVSFEIKRGEFLGIIGPNGSGKSTLFRLMTRVLLPQEGMVTFEGSDIRNTPLKEFCRKAAFVSQDTLINFPFSVREVVMMGRIPHQKRLQGQSKQDLAMVERAISLTGISSIAQKCMDEISSGERQRVIIAKALAQEPQLMFLDEPTSHLDIGHQVQILDLLKRLNRGNQLTIAMVLHDLNLASEYCSRIILLDEGKVFKDGLAEDVLTYQNIESVYKTVVVVNKNSISKKPYVVLVSQEK